MHGNTCPHCGKLAVGLLHKQIIGVGTRTACMACGGMVGVGKAALFGLLPLLIVVATYDMLPTRPAKIAAWIAGLAVTIVLQTLTPLIKK